MKNVSRLFKLSCYTKVLFFIIIITTISYSAYSQCSNVSTGGVISGGGTYCTPIDPPAFSSSSLPTGGSGTILYQWESSINNSSWTEISGATTVTYDHNALVTSTTYFRRKARRLGCSTWAGISNVLTVTINTTPTVNAGPDQSKCEISNFTLTGNTPLSGQTSSWSVVSGSALTSQPTSSNPIVYSIPSGTSATLRYTVSSSGCSASDDVVITNNNTGCNTSCSNSINSNTDIENAGNITTYPLTFQSTPAALISSTARPLSWKDRYGSNVANTSTFVGAYYLNKTGTAGHPRSGSKFIYLNGNNYSASAYSISGPISCERTYQISFWVAAYTNGATQTNSDFAFETLFSGSASAANHTSIIRLRAPASSSWNNLNWTRYVQTVTVPNNQYTAAEFFFTTYNSSGIVIDDVCITDISTLFSVNAGPDITQCHNSAFLVDAVDPSSGSTINWSVVSGNALLTSPLNNDTLFATVPAGQTATVRYSITNSGCTVSDDVILTNTTTCSTTCINPINHNGDFETEGAATSFPLTFQGTSAALISKTNPIPGWDERYGSVVPNTSAFTGAYYIKSNGSNANPKSGTHMVYMAGNFCLAGFTTGNNLNCGKTYKLSAWMAAFTNGGGAQATSRVNIEMFLTNSNPALNKNQIYNLVLPASTSWTSLNWQRYEVIINLPTSGFTWADFIFTTYSNNEGVLIDDVCITEVTTGSQAKAGLDQYNCSNSFNLSANNPPSGYTGTWSVVSGSASISSVNSPNTTATITSGTNALLRWTVSDGTCTSSNDVALSYTNTSGVSVSNRSICPGSSTTLTASNCSGSLLWSNGSTTSNITVSPTTTTSYSVTCMPSMSTNDVLNSGFESNFTSWNNYQNSGVTSTIGEFRSGSRGGRINASSAWGGFGQDISVTPGQYFHASAWIKVTNTIRDAAMFISFYNSSWTLITKKRIPVTSQTWKEYALTAVSPPNSAWLTISFETSSGAFMYVDDVEVRRAVAGCISSTTATVNVDNYPISMSNPVVSPAIDHALQDVATVDVTVSWTNTPIGNNIRVTYGDKTEIINVSSGLTSPQTVRFLTPANGQANQLITAMWSNLTCGSTSRTFNAPNPINTYSFNCNILYLCGKDKPADGDAWDHGFMDYLMLFSNGTITPALTKPDASGLGLYDPDNESSPLFINLNDFNAIIISPTTYTYLSNNLKVALSSFPGSILSMEHESLNAIGMSNGAGYYIFTNNAYKDAVNTIAVYNYDNPTSTYQNLIMGANRKPGGTANLWTHPTVNTSQNNAASYQHLAHSLLNTSSTHGKRYFLGFHMNGLYANSENGGSLPAPISSYFTPTKHLTLEAKAILDLAIRDGINCGVENCINGFDDDGDGLSDCADPDCGQIINREFDNGSAEWNLVVAGGANATFSIDNTSQISGYHSARININTVNSNPSNIRFRQINRTLSPNKTYRLTFKAKASTARTISSELQLGIAPNTTYRTQNHSLTTTTQTFTYTFANVNNVSTNNLNIIFNLGQATGIVYIDDVRFEEVCCPNILPNVSGSTSICEGGSTTLTSTPSGGLSPYSYSWSNSSTNNNITVSPASSTSYTVTVLDNNSCFTINTTNITVNSKPSISVSGPTSICVGTNTNLLPNSGGIWISNNPTVASISNTGQVTGLAEGTATFTFTNSTTNCSSNASTAITVNPRPTVSITGPTSICVGSTTTLSPTTGGTWTSTNPGVATVSNSGVVTGVSAGTATFVFTSSTTGCNSNPTSSITIVARPIIDINNASTSLCIGTTTNILPSSGGSWTSSNPSIATINNSGLITPLAPGNVTFTFTRSSDGCSSLPSIVFTVTNKPSVNITGSSAICVGSTTTLSPTSGGTWTSSNNAVATVNNSGVVTGVAPGNVTFTFSQSGSCVSDPTNQITVNAKPVINSDNSNLNLCEGNTTNILPSSGGTWTSSNPSVATISNIGVITAISAGTVQFTFTQSGTNCVSNPSPVFNVNSKPAVEISGPNSICVGSTTNLLPNTGGTWVSSNSSIATVNNNGLVTGVSEGNVTFLFIRNSDGCQSNVTGVITVNPKPTVSVVGSLNICINTTTQLSPNTGGTWTSNNPGIASVNNNGLVTGISSGTATFVFTNSTTNCTSDPTAIITVNPRPTVSINGSSSICQGSTTSLLPNTGGTWSSSDNNIATVNNSGIVTGKNPGMVNFTFTNNTTNCPSDPTNNITVLEKPVITLSGPSQICIGSNTSISSSMAGTWISSNPSIATISNNGIVTGISPGNVIFTLQANNGCISNPSAIVTVDLNTGVILSGDNELCIGETSQLSASKNNGVWQSDNTNVASISPTGLVTAVSAGNATISYSINDDGCNTYATISILVNPMPVALVTGPSTICQGKSTTLSPTSGGTWVSNNTNIATVNNFGIVTGVGAGTTTFRFTDLSTGCQSNITSPVQVLPKPVISNLPKSILCIGETMNLTPNSGGIWTSSNSTIASVTSNGVVTGLSHGEAYFIFTSTSNGCSSNTEGNVSVGNNVSVTLNYPNQQCLSNNTSIVANVSGGTPPYTLSWSNSSGILSNNNTLNVSSAGIYTFTVSDLTGCSSTYNAQIFDSFNPIISKSNDYICPGDSVTLLVSGLNIASYNWANGSTDFKIKVAPNTTTSYSVVVTSVNGCTSLLEIDVNVKVKPIISLNGPSTICPGTNTNLSPSTGGVWNSSNQNVATISNDGVVTGIAGGIATFTFTSSVTGCSSDPSTNITVNPKPSISYNGPRSICVGLTTSLIPNNGGTWTSSNPSVATINNAGLVQSLTNGVVTFTFTSSSTNCISDASLPLTVKSKPTVVVSGPSNICVGTTTSLLPSAGGTWISSNPVIASITNSGVVTGLGTGTANFIFTETGGCASDPSTNIVINPKPIISINGNNPICANSTTSLISNENNGIWSSIFPAIATINSSTGEVTGHTQGFARFQFTSLTTGCISEESAPVQINGLPVITVNGPTSVCLGNSFTMSPTSGGVWQSNNPTVATINNAGLVTTLSPGVVSFKFTDNSTGCVSNNSSNVIINNKPIISLNGPNPICVGGSTNLLPSSGGVWQSNNSIVASINNNGKVTGLSSGAATFTYTDNTTGCVSDASTSINVINTDVVSIDGPSSICIGTTTQLLPTVGGVWSSSNNNIATVNSNGVVTGVSAGNVTFTFINSTTGCSSSLSTPVTVLPNALISLNGPSAICIGSNSQLNPSSGGVWTSNNPTIASITNNGTILGISEGTTSFTYTDLTTGCKTTSTFPFSVYQKPQTSLSGQNTICIGTTTSFTPSTGGIWTSNNPNVASISNNGIVTGVGIGTATFIFVESGSGCISENTIPITVSDKTPVSLNGPSSICIGETTNLLPSSGGVWISNNPSVATINNNGQITGLSQGLATFYFTNQSGCISDVSQAIKVNGKPTIINAQTQSLCVGSALQISSSSNGTWSSSNNNVAIINNNGLITGVSPGIVNFTFTDNLTGCSVSTASPYIVNSLPTATSTSNSLCIGSTLNLFPSSGGVWTSSNPNIASVTLNGLVTGLAQGVVNFTFTNSTTNCSSPNPVQINVSPRPNITLLGSDNICIGSTTSFSANATGTWQSKNPNIASINNQGIVTGLAAGIAKFEFTNSQGCQSNLSASITVNPKPNTFINGPANICVGSTTNLSPNVGGVWTSNAPNVASINNSGRVIGLSPGTATFTFTETLTGCSSTTNNAILTVVNPPSLNFDGPSRICIGQSSRMIPNSGGVWISSNPDIATINNNGLIVAKAPGKVFFTFTDSQSGCSSTFNLPLEVVNCVDPDFNVTLTNVVVKGNVRTNDEFTSILNQNRNTNTVTYETPILITKPHGSISTFNLQESGEYTFKGNLPGQYIYTVGVCMPPLENGCYRSNITFTVLSESNIEGKIVSNTDIATTYKRANKNIFMLQNDKCIGRNCSISNNQVWNLGNYTQNIIGSTVNNGWMPIIPQNNFIGIDTVWYKVCDLSNNCLKSFLLLTVNDSTALNSTVAADDFFASYQDTVITGNVLDNDSDPENNLITVTPQGSASNMVTIPEGKYYIESNGNFKFIPSRGFYGPLDIVYTLCDANNFCANATIHLLVIKEALIRTKVYLEGSLIDTRELSSNNKPLMRDDLRNNPFTQQNSIPSISPYSNKMQNFDIRSQFKFDNPNKQNYNTAFESIENSNTIFAITGENAIVDWVLIEIRDKSDSTNVLLRRSALLQRDGDVVDIDGQTTGLRLSGVTADSFYLVIKHRNHLGIMSKKVAQNSFVDFTSLNTPVFDFGTSKVPGLDFTGLATNNYVKPGYRALWGGDFDGNGKIKFTNPSDDQNLLFFDVLSHLDNQSGNANFDYSVGYYQGDFNLNGKSKYDNPNDDKNFLFGQIVLYPLNTNFLSNFNFFIEQVPPARN